MRFTTNYQFDGHGLPFAAMGHIGPLTIEKWVVYRFVHLPTRLTMGRLDINHSEAKPAFNTKRLMTGLAN